jgi:hypothetical protein
MAQAWVMTVAGQRLHDTIFRQPAEAFLKERLRPHHGRPPVPSLHRAVSAGPLRCTGALRARSRSRIRGPSSPPIPGPTASICCAWTPPTIRHSDGTFLHRRHSLALRNRWR